MKVILYTPALEPITYIDINIPEVGDRLDLPVPYIGLKSYSNDLYNNLYKEEQLTVVRIKIDPIDLNYGRVLYLCTTQDVEAAKKLRPELLPGQQEQRGIYGTL